MALAIGNGILGFILKILLVLLLIILIYRRIKKQKLLSKGIKAFILLIIIFGISNICASLLLNNAFYIFGFLVFSTLLLLYFYICKIRQLFKVKKIWWILSMLLVIISIILAVIGTNEALQEFKEDKLGQEQLERCMQSDEYQEFLNNNKESWNPCVSPPDYGSCGGIKLF